MKKSWVVTITNRNRCATVQVLGPFTMRRADRLVDALVEKLGSDEYSVGLFECSSSMDVDDIINQIEDKD